MDVIQAIHERRAYRSLEPVAHPIAGFSPKKTKEILGIPEEYQVITLIIVGKRAKAINPGLSQKQLEWEKARPERLPLEKIAFMNYYQAEEVGT